MLRGARCNDQALVLRALDELLQHGVQVCCDFIDQGEPTLSERDKTARNDNAAMLNKMPVTCKGLHATARGDRRYSAIMFYERTRLGAAASGHFLEGLAPGLSLFSGDTRVSLADDDLKKLKLRDIVADRMRTVGNLELMGNGGEKLSLLIRDYTLRDTAAGLPGRVHVFIARMRAICQGLQRVKPASHFRQCRNCECARLFYAGAPTETRPTSAPPPDSGPGTSAEGHCYWDMAAGAPDVDDAQGAFCTWSCCTEWRWQLRSALPEADNEVLVADYQCRKRGRPRVPEALRACSKRNQRAARHMRTIEKEGRVFPAVSSAELKRQRQRQVRLLNVDLGVLYAASVLAESRTLCADKVLPGAAEGWRSRPAFYAKAVKEVAKIYTKHHVGGNVISNMLIHEPFLVRVKQRASKIF